MRAGGAAAALLLIAGMGVTLLSGRSGTSGPVEQGEAGLSGESAVRAARQRLLRKQLHSAYLQAIGMGLPAANAAAFDKTGKPLLPESLALRRMYARDPDDKIKVDDPSAVRRQTTDIGRVFGLGPFGEDGMGLAQRPLEHIALVNHLLPRS